MKRFLPVIEPNTTGPGRENLNNTGALNTKESVDCFDVVFDAEFGGCALLMCRIAASRIYINICKTAN